MMSSLVDAVLLVALVLTSACVVVMYRKLRRLDAYHQDYQRILAQTATALEAARSAVESLQVDGRELVSALGRRIEEARAVMAEIDEKRAALGGPAPRAGNAAPPRR
jgi:hypothetical protein